MSVYKERLDCAGVFRANLVPDYMNVSNTHYLGASCFIVFGALLAPSLAKAEAWQVRPSVMLEERYNDNFTLDSTSPVSSIESLLRGSLAFTRLTESSEVSGRLHAGVQSYYFSDEFHTSNNQYVTFYSLKKLELSQWKFDSTFRRDSTTRSFNSTQDITQDSVDGIGDVDEGFVSVELKRNTFRLNPGWNYQVDERSNLSMDYQFTGAFYENNRQGTELYDYNQHSLSLGYSRSLSEREGVGTTASFSRYSAADNENISIDSQTLKVGYWNSFSETTKGSISLGLRRSAGEDDVSDFDQLGYIFRLKLKYKTELNQISGTIVHDLEPSGSGTLYESTQLGLDVSRAIRPRLSAALNSSVYTNDSIDSSSSDRWYYLSISSSLNWQMTRWWTVGGGLMYRVRERIESPDDADSKIIFLTVRYSKGIDID